MRKIREALCLLGCLALLLSSGPARAAGKAEPDTVRVLLSRLALTDRADLTLSGRYLARTAAGTDLLLPENAKLTVQLREGSLILFHGGLSLSAGSRLLLLRQESAGSAFIRFGAGENRYPGDLSLGVRDGQLYPVLTLDVEDYVPGVVPYEMSERFPPEALKAQSVCVRTYALSRRDPSRAYDVVDTASDQVFRGIHPENRNAAAAAAETHGLVLTVGGKLAEGWYSASNGGQTELPSHAWSSPGSRCYAITDDPYDAENPESLTRSVLLRKDASNLGGALTALIRTSVLALPEMSGYLTGEDDFRVDSLIGMELKTPRYPAPSRLMTELEMVVSVSGRKAGPSPAPTWHDADTEDLLLFENPGEETAVPIETPSPTPAPGGLESAGEHRITLRVFPDVLSALGLSISGADNELLTAADEGNAFRITSARFGHGVGLSQRGAQWMAARYGKTCEEILAFYYPGSRLTRREAVPAALPTPDPALAETPGPPATPTPRPTLMPVTAEDLPEGAYLASVENIEDDSSLNLRAAPSPGAEILMRLYRHQLLIVLEEDQVPGWVKVRTDSIEGYVMRSFLERVD